MKKFLSASALLLAAIILCSCNAAPSVTMPTGTASGYPLQTNPSGTIPLYTSGTDSLYQPTDSGSEPQRSDSSATSPAETPTVPAETPAGTPTEPSTETPTETPTQKPVDTPTETEATEELPTEVPTLPSTEAPTLPPIQTIPPADDVTPPIEDTYYKITNYDDVKAIWLSQFDLDGVFANGGKQRAESEYTSLITKMLDNIEANGFNTVFIQLRPNADSIYPSSIYPPSGYAVGSYGQSFEYDPIMIFVRAAKNQGLSVHGWINPMRAMTDTQIKLVPDDFKIKQWYNDENLNGKYIVKIGNNWYLNPAYEEVRALIVNGAREAMLMFEFDGLHMDDYFYPTTEETFDFAAYSEYKSGGGDMSLAEWRRNNINLLVKATYEMTKDINPNAIYGISPAGNQATVYDKQYADYKTWCSKSGYIDYICPQVYFGLEHAAYDFVKVSKAWQDAVKTGSVKLIIGMTLGKALNGYDEYAGSGKYEWRDNKDIMKRCLIETEKLDKCVGVSFFCYEYFYNAVSGEEISETQQERNNFIPYFKDMSWK